MSDDVAEMLGTPPKRLQLKDLDTKVILRELAKWQGRWSTWGEREYVNEKTGEPYMINIQLRTYPGSPDRLWLKKMTKLMNKGYVGGCDCGCRGDYEITDEGLALIGVERTVAYNGY